MWFNHRNRKQSQRNAVTPAGKSVLVTGASSGIGYATAMTLSQRGFHVFAGARKSEDIDVLNQHNHVTGVRLDVTSVKDITAAVEFINSHPAKFHGVVNNAGIISCAPLVEVDESEVKEIFDVNVYGAYRVTKAFAETLIAAKGRIVNIGSVSGLVANAFNGLYGMSKHALEAFSEALAMELAEFGVSVSSIMPASYHSRLGKNMLARVSTKGQPARRSMFEEQMRQRMEFFKRDFSKILDEPDQVADTVFDALTVANPRKRYIVVPGRRAAWALKSKVIRRTLRMSNSPGRPGKNQN
jgi:NAD(P)-dependent dehydrogenase (short-subunit alcohol dehydrogenase family)